MPFSDELIDKVRAASDIVSVAEQYFPLKRAGVNFTALCPFHSEKTPSFIVSRQKQIFKCFGCGEGGNVFNFVMKMDKVTFPEAVRMLAERAGIEIKERKPTAAEKRKEYLFSVMESVASFYVKNFDADSRAKKYAASRGITKETADRFGVGFSPDASGLLSYAKKQNIKLKDLETLGLVVSRQGRMEDKFRFRLIFPIRDVKGRTVGFGGRALGESKVKYLNSPETVLFHKSDILYALKEAKRSIIDTGSIIIAEGYMDVVAMHQFGFTNATGVLGTSLTDRHAYAIKRFTDDVYILFDSDDAGVNAAMRAAVKVIEVGLEAYVVRLRGAKDADEFLHKFGAPDFRKCIDGAVPVFDFLRDIFSRRYSGKSPAWKAKVVEEMRVYLDAVPNAVTRSEQVKKTAKFLDVQEGAVISEVGKTAAPKTDYKRRETPAEPAALSSRQKLEEEIATFLVQYPEHIDLFRSKIKPDEFVHMGSLLEKIYVYFADKGKTDISGFMSMLTGEGDAGFVNSIAAAASGGEKGIDKKKIQERGEFARSLIDSFRRIVDNEEFARLRKQVIDNPTKEAVERYTRLAAWLKK